MADRIRVNYPALEDMANHCKMVSDRLNQTAMMVQKSAGQMQNGALLGAPGDIYVQALGILHTKVSKLSLKFAEEANDIKQAMADMQQADGTAGSQFTK